jgi:hypothetical protein
MEQSQQTNQEFPRISWNPEFHYRIPKAGHLSLSWATSIQSVHSCLKTILILSYRMLLRVQNNLFHSGFPTKTL